MYNEWCLKKRKDDLTSKRRPYSQKYERKGFKRMRKKSHILLARYLADQMPAAKSLQCHRKAFCLGNILPDMKPSFLTKRHEFTGTFPQVKEKLRALTVDLNLRAPINERVYWRRLGEVLHYVADYFTFPHNDTYQGTLLQHNQYEKLLKKDLKNYIQSGQAVIHARKALTFRNLQELIDFISISHGVYLKKERNVPEDIEFILTVCFQVIQGVFQLLARRWRKEALVGSRTWIAYTG